MSLSESPTGLVAPQTFDGDNQDHLLDLLETPAHQILGQYTLLLKVGAQRLHIGLIYGQAVLRFWISLPWPSHVSCS